jgi:hypothetical protein
LGGTVVGKLVAALVEGVMAPSLRVVDFSTEVDDGTRATRDGFVFGPTRCHAVDFCAGRASSSLKDLTRDTGGNFSPGSLFVVGWTSVDCLTGVTFSSLLALKLEIGGSSSLEALLAAPSGTSSGRLAVLGRCPSLRRVACRTSALSSGK